jgi:hypothetical protein
VGGSGYSLFPPSYPGFVWTAATGRYDFGLEPGMPINTVSVDATNDGQTLVGSFSNVNGGTYPTHAYRKVGSGPLQDLESLPPWTSPPVPLTGWFDLVQVYCMGATDQSTGGPAGVTQGADLNYSGSSETSDLLRFSDYFSRSIPAANSNNDGQIDATDIAAFAAAYNP